MSAFTPLSSSNIPENMSMCVKGLLKDQDVAFCGSGCNEEGEKFNWGVVLDGHGTHLFINLMREQNWQLIMTSNNPWKTLNKILEQIQYTYGFCSGSTLLMLRSFSESTNRRIETITVGDSELVVFKNGKQIYKNTPHNMNNPSEVERLQMLPSNIFMKFKPSRHYIPQIACNTFLQAKRGGYFHFANTEIAMSQAIGQNNITGYAPEFNVIPFTEEDHMRVVMGSDGLFEMLLLKENILPISKMNKIVLEQLQMEIATIFIPTFTFITSITITSELILNTIEHITRENINMDPAFVKHITEEENAQILLLSLEHFIQTIIITDETNKVDVTETERQTLREIINLILLNEKVQTRLKFIKEQIINIQQDMVDLLTKTATELVDKTEARWVQPWIYHYDPNDHSSLMKDTSFPCDSYDDISCIVWQN
jgi:serine/threonine protein phosphatase PrpC